MWGHWSVKKKLLIWINIVYVPLSLVLMVLGRLDMIVFWDVHSLKIVKGILVSGIFMLLVSVIGIIVFSRRESKLQLFYTIILSIVAVLQLSIACAFSVKNDTEYVENECKYLWEADDKLAPYDSNHNAEVRFQCCGYDEDDQRRNTSNTDIVVVLEREWCIRRVDACELTRTMEQHENDKHMITKLLDSTFRGTNTSVSLTLTCPSCGKDLVNQLKTIKNSIGAAAIFIALTEFIVVGVAFFYWKYVENEYLLDD